MSTRTWHKGTPPFPGWWNASWDYRHEVWRWWDGHTWSQPVFLDDGMNYIKVAASRPDPLQIAIEWTDYWPENARVPRVDPRSKL